MKISCASLPEVLNLCMHKSNSLHCNVRKRNEILQFVVIENPQVS